MTWWAWLEEIARHQIAFKTSCGSALALSRTNHYVVDYLTHRGRHFRILMRQIVGSYVLQALASAVLLGVGGWLVISRQLTLGQLVAAELVVALVVSGFTKFGKHLETYYDLMAAMDKLGYLTDLPVERLTGEALPEATGPVSVRFAGITVAAGERIGLVGSTGAGKSTLLDALYGMRTPIDGIVEFDGRDLRDIKLGDLRSQISLVRGAADFRRNHPRKSAARLRRLGFAWGAGCPGAGRPFGACRQPAGWTTHAALHRRRTAVSRSAGAVGDRPRSGAPAAPDGVGRMPGSAG